MRYRSRPRRGKGTEDPFDDRAEIPIEPLRSMTLGADDSSSSSGGRQRGRFEDGQSTDSGDLRDSGMWVRPEPGWEDQPSGVRRRSGFSSSSLLRRSAGLGGQGSRSRLLIVVVGLVAIVLVVGTFAVAARQRNSGSTAGSSSPIEVPSSIPTALATPSLVPPSDAGSPAPLPSLPSLTPSPPSAAPTPARTVSPRVLLDTLRPAVVADGASGRKMVAVLGRTTFPNSTSVFVSCSTRPATLTYRLGGGFTQLSAVVGLTGSSTPGDLVAQISVVGDGRTLAMTTVSLDRTAGVSVNLSGVRTMVVTAQRISGECRNSDQPYGVLGTATLRR
jgi:hypothetical protein